MVLPLEPELVSEPGVAYTREQCRRSGSKGRRAQPQHGSATTGGERVALDFGPLPEVEASYLLTNTTVCLRIRTVRRCQGLHLARGRAVPESMGITQEEQALPAGGECENTLS